MVNYYLNLTNGIEFLDRPDFNIKEYKFVRIQSTACEKHLWDKILMDLDYNFLLDLALGNEVIVCDTSQRKIISRALYQGLEFIRFVLNKYWLGKDIIPYVRNMNCSEYFQKEYKKLDNKTFKKLKYLKKFLNTDKINLTCISFNTNHDGDYNYYKNILIKNNKNFNNSIDK